MTRLTLRVHALPETFGAVNFTVRAAPPAAFRRLVRMALDLGAHLLVAHPAQAPEDGFTRRG